MDRRNPRKSPAKRPPGEEPSRFWAAGGSRPPMGQPLELNPQTGGPGKGRARINAPKTRPGGTRASFGGVFTRAALAWAASLGA